MPTSALQDAIHTLYRVGERNTTMVELLVRATRAEMRRTYTDGDFVVEAKKAIFDSAADVPHDRLFCHAPHCPILLKPLGLLLAQLEGWTLASPTGLIAMDGSVLSHFNWDSDTDAYNFVVTRCIDSFFHKLALQSHDLNSKR